MRYAPDLRFHLDNSFAQFNEAQETARNHIKEYVKDQVEQKRIAKGQLIGAYQKMAAPMMDMRKKVKLFASLSKENQYQMLMELPDDDERKALQELMQVENSNKMIKDIDTKMDRLRADQKATHDRLKAQDEMP